MSWLKDKLDIRSNPKNIWNDAKSAIVLGMNYGPDNDIFEDCIDDSRVNDQVPCIEIYDPVCGCNDKTYPNSCYAEREGVIEWSKGVCK